MNAWPRGLARSGLAGAFAAMGCSPFESSTSSEGNDGGTTEFCSRAASCDQFERAAPEAAPWSVVVTGDGCTLSIEDVAGRGRSLKATSSAVGDNQRSAAFLTQPLTGPWQTMIVSARARGVPAGAGVEDLLGIRCFDPRETTSVTLRLDKRGLSISGESSARGKLFDSLLSSDPTHWHNYVLVRTDTRLLAAADEGKPVLLGTVPEAWTSTSGKCAIDLGAQTSGALPALEIWLDDFRVE